MSENPPELAIPRQQAPEWAIPRQQAPEWAVPRQHTPMEMVDGAVDQEGVETAKATEVTDEDFYLKIGKHAEGHHGDTPVDTKDAKEAGKAIKSKDVGFGHKVKASEEKAKTIHGVTFIDHKGDYIALTKAEQAKILKEDMKAELALARTSGWDKKLKDLSIKWEDLKSPYKQALTSLAYNTGGKIAGGEFTSVLKAAKQKDVKEFAKQLRRNDAGKKTAGMDNRVAKELYYSGLIQGLSEVKESLPLATAKAAGIPQGETVQSNKGESTEDSQDALRNL